MKDSIQFEEVIRSRRKASNIKHMFTKTRLTMRKKVPFVKK